MFHSQQDFIRCDTKNIVGCGYYNTLDFFPRSLVADVQQKEEDLEESRKKLSALIETSKKDIGDMQAIYDHAMKNVWSKQPGFADMMDLAKKNLEIDAQIEAAIKRNEDINRAIAEAEIMANQQGLTFLSHSFNRP